MKKVIVTGASGKLGQRITEAFSRQGWQVLRHYNTSGHETAGTINADFNTVTAESFIKRCLELFGRADLLVNCFSSFCNSTFFGTDWDSFAAEIYLNSWMPFDLCRHFCANNPAAGVINVLDTRITGPDDEHFNYHISKLLLKEFTIEAARSLGPEHRVNAVAPGLIDGGKADRLPLQKSGTPADVASAVLYLAGADFVTGQIIFVDGGRHIRDRNG